MWRAGALRKQLDLCEWVEKVVKLWGARGLMRMRRAGSRRMRMYWFGGLLSRSSMHKVTQGKGWTNDVSVGCCLIVLRRGCGLHGRHFPRAAEVRMCRF